ncbi:hypothetical protein T439DRAFT_380699 [Meredithblackwellia eburnea MCA 4105]
MRRPTPSSSNAWTTLVAALHPAPSPTKSPRIRSLYQSNQPQSWSLRSYHNSNPRYHQPAINYHQSQSQIPQPTTLVKPKPFLANLLKQVRKQRHESPSPNPSPKSVIAALSSSLNQQPEPPPTVLHPPLTADTGSEPDPSHPNPHLLNAFWLQALFLGASALGLLVRRPKQHSSSSTAISSIESRDVEEEAIATRLHAESLEINLLLSSYSPFPTEDPTTGREMREPFSLPRALRALDAIAGALTRFSPEEDWLVPEGESGAAVPDHWTVLSVMRFVNSLPKHPADPPTKVDLAKPTLVLWAWRAFVSLSLRERERGRACTQTGMPTGTGTRTRAHPADVPLLASFMDYLSNPPSFGMEMTLEVMESLTHYLAGGELVTSRPPPLDPPPSRPLLPPLPLPIPPKAHSTILNALSTLSLSYQSIPSIIHLLSLNSQLGVRERIKLGHGALLMLSKNEDWRSMKPLVRLVGEMVADNVRLAFGKERREWRRLGMNPDEELRGPVEGGSHTELTRDDLVLVRGSVDLLKGRFRVDGPLEDIYSDIVLVLLSHAQTLPPSTSLPPTWILSILTSLVHARHPKLALSVFLSSDPTTLTIKHYNALLRLDHIPTSNQVFRTLVLRSETNADNDERSSSVQLRPTHDTFVSRLVALSHPRNREIAHDRAYETLRIMSTRFSLEMNVKIWNALLNVLVKSGCGERRVYRAWLRMERSGVKPDGYTWMILLGRMTRGCAVTGEGRGKEGGETRTTKVGSGRIGRRQIKGVLRRTRELEEVELGEGGESKEDFQKIALNVLLRTLGRWADTIRTRELVVLCREVLGVDLSLPLDDQRVTIPSREEWEKTRKQGYAILVKALGNRGEKALKRTLVEARRREEGAMRRREEKEKREEICEKKA